MIVVASKPGQLGNLLVVYANLLAWGIEHNKKIANPAFAPYAIYFQETPGFSIAVNNIAFKLSYFTARVLDRLKLSNPLFGTIHIDWEQKVNLDDGKKALPPVRLLFVQGWQYRCSLLLKKHAAVIRKKFTPLAGYRKTLDALFKSVPPGHVVIGIHIRRGDYKRFQNGAYYFEPGDYETVMDKISALLATEHISFLISTNEPPTLTHFKNSRHNIIAAPGHELLDMYALARCNYIAGPPSTYTMWASFFGQVPLYMIRDPRISFNLSDFHVQTSF